MNRYSPYYAIHDEVNIVPKSAGYHISHGPIFVTDFDCDRHTTYTKRPKIQDHLLHTRNQTANRTVNQLSDKSHSVGRNSVCLIEGNELEVCYSLRKSFFSNERGQNKNPWYKTGGKRGHEQNWRNKNFKRLSP